MYFQLAYQTKIRSMYQLQYSQFLPYYLKPSIQILTDSSKPLFNSTGLNSINQEHQSLVFDCLLDSHQRLLVNFYSFIKESFNQQLQPFLLKLLWALQIFLFPCLKLIVFILEQFYLNFVEVAATIIKELQQFCLDSIFYTVHKLLVEA